MWQYYNPNPYGKMVDDCTVRALSIIEDVDWFGAYFMLCIEGARLGDMPNANSVMRVLLRKKGYTRHIVPDTCPDCYTVYDFARDYCEGTFLVCTGSHVIAVRDGVYYDTTDSGYEIVLYFYKKENDYGSIHTV